jgi:NADH:ubiquinone oxidoreductase subunit H
MFGEWTMDNSTPVFWIWIAVVILFAAAVTFALYVIRKAWGRFTKRNG